MNKIIRTEIVLALKTAKQTLISYNEYIEDKKDIDHSWEKMVYGYNLNKMNDIDKVLEKLNEEYKGWRKL